MSGSRKDVDYVADNGDIFVIQVDESNVELIMGAAVPIGVSTRRKPSNLKTLRSVVLKDALQTTSRTIPVLSQARYNALNGTSTFTLPSFDGDTGLTVGVAIKIPEKFTRLPKSFDTEKTDGDST